ncbi:MAG: CAP domain-containing protein [Bacteroidetes bacterium]|nr:CAP domain-containing protein [Bacteroidota bacterium]
MIKIHKYLFVSFLFITLSISAFSQNRDDVIDAGNVNLKYLEYLTKLEIDSVRKSVGLSILYNDSVLYLAATDHSKYLTKIEKLTHFQKENAKKKSPFNRVEFYGSAGYASSVGENAIMIYILTPTSFKNKKNNESGETHIVSTYKEAAVEMMTGWVNSKGHYANIVTKDFNITGMALSYNEKKQIIYGVQVFGVSTKNNLQDLSPTTFPYENKAPKVNVNISQKNKDKVSKHKKHAWSLKAADNSKECLECSSAANSTKDIILSGYNDSLYLTFSNANLINKLIKNKHDGFALEFSTFDYLYTCDSVIGDTTPSRQNGGCIFNGKVSKPVYKKEIFAQLKKKNLNKNKKTKGRTVIYICPFPKYFYFQNGEINILILNKKRVCSILKTKGVCGEIWEPELTDTINYIYNPPGVYKPKALAQTLVYKNFFEKDRYDFNPDSLKNLLNDIVKDNNTIIKAEVIAFASVEGNYKLNQNLFNNRSAQLIKTLLQSQDTVVKLNVKTEENWALFFKQIKNTKYAFLSGKDTAEIRKYVNINSDDMEPLLAKERYAQLKLVYKNKISDANIEGLSLRDYYGYINEIRKFNLSIPSYENVLMLEKIQLYFYDRYIKAKDKTEISKYIELIEYQIVDDPSLISLQFNKLMFDRQNSISLEADSLFGEGLKRLKKHKFNSKRFLFNYNAYNFNHRKDDYWNSQFDANVLYSLISKSEFLLSENDSNVLENLTLLYHFKKANAFYMKTLTNFKNAEGSLTYIKNFYEKHRPNDAQKFILAKYFICFEKYNWAMTYLESLISAENYKHEALTLYLILKYYLESEKSSSEVAQLIMDAENKLTNAEWCGMFTSVCNIPLKAFMNKPLKLLYCKKCRE